MEDLVWTCKRIPSVLSILTVLPLFAACSGGGESTSPTVQLSSAEAQAVVTALFQNMSLGLANAGYTADRVSRDKVAAASASATRMPNFSFATDCKLGGKIVATGSFVDNTNSSGTGTVTESGTFTPQACVLSTGSRQIAVDGDPNIAWNFTTTLNGSAQPGDVTWSMIGGIKWTGGSCSLNYTMRVSPNGTGSVTGSLCGQGVSTTF